MCSWVLLHSSKVNPIAGGVEKLATPSGKTQTPEEAKSWRSVTSKALTPEVVMSLQLLKFVEVFSDGISKCVSLHCQWLQATGPVCLASKF